jgi:hypothetical protein
MNEVIPKICIDGRAVDYIQGAYVNSGGLTAATLQFELAVMKDGYRKLWNKEVTFYLNQFDSTPMFRGYIKRVQEDFDKMTIYAQDIIGYMVKGGSPDEAKIALTNEDNIDGLTVGNAIRKAVSKAQLGTKVGTAIIGDTTPSFGSSRPPLRGTLSVKDIIKTLISRAVDNSASVPKPNLIRVVDDGSMSQLVIELESDLDTSTIKHVFTEYGNIIDLKIIKRKVPTIVIVNGLGNVKGTFVHEGAMEALDRNYLEVTNTELKSPAECKDFAQKLFRANLETQYEYSIKSPQGAYLNENDVIRVETEDPVFTGNYRVRGKKVSFSTGGFNVGLNINRKPPTLAEYIVQQDN